MHSPLRRVAIVAVGALLTSLIAGSAHADPAIPLTALGYSSTAAGTRADLLGGAVSSGPTAPTALGGSTYPASRDNSVLSARVDPVLRAGVVTTTASSAATSTQRSITSQARTADLSVLGGLITAEALRTRATASSDGSTSDGSASTEFVRLKVGSIAIPLDVPSNFTVEVPGVARVTLNQSSVTRIGPKASVRGAAVSVTLLQAFEGAAVGSTILIDPVTADIGPAAPSDALGVGGHAYGTQVTGGVGPRIGAESGRTSYLEVPGGGTFAQELSTAAADVDVPGLLRTGVVRSTVQATSVPKVGEVVTGDSITSVSVLGGLITADAVTAQSRAVRSANGATTLTGTSRLANLTVAGIRLPAQVPPNTVIPLLGLGRVVVNEQVRSGSSVTTRALHVVVDAPLAARADVQVAVAKAVIG